jgi:hypothetical protein
VSARFKEHCALSREGKVFTDPEAHWLFYTAEGFIDHGGVTKHWLQFSYHELRRLLNATLYPYKPKSPLECLAEAKDD